MPSRGEGRCQKSPFAVATDACAHAANWPVEVYQTIGHIPYEPEQEEPQTFGYINIHRGVIHEEGIILPIYFRLVTSEVQETVPCGRYG